MLKGLSRRDFLRNSGLAAAVAGLSTYLPGQIGGAYAAAQATHERLIFLPQEDPAIHVLNRLGYGARPGDVVRVRRMGVDTYIEEQLHPEGIDDHLLEYLLESLTLLSPDITSLLQMYNAFQQNPTLPDPGSDGAMQSTQARLLRAAFSKRQLQERMVEFFSDHLNIPHDYDYLSLFKLVDEREVIRSHVLGKFHDLVLASARSPAMIQYLSNDDNVKGHPNENYAREVMELHTTSPASGYTQKDVQELARCFTGWSLNYDTGLFEFHPDDHDSDAKTVLGLQIAAGGGVEDAEQVLYMLTHHPATATFLCTKLCRFFITDDPQADLSTIIAQAAHTFLTTDGDLRQVMRTILHSSVFMASVNLRVKRPFYFACSALRALEAQIPLDQSGAQLGELITLGEPPGGWQPPNGAPQSGRAWITFGGLLARYNFAVDLCQADSGSGFTVDLKTPLGQRHAAGEIVDFWTLRIFNQPLPAAARDGLIAYVSDGGGPDTLLDDSQLSLKLEGLGALLLGAAAFQVH